MPMRPDQHKISNEASQDGIQITYRPVGELKPNPANPRTHSKKQILQIAASISAFQFNVPVLVDSESRVIAGHGRLLAARELGLSTVPTISLGHLSEAQIKAFTIADNKLTDNSSWDQKLLAEQLKVLSEAELDFDIEITGFELAEIDVLLDLSVNPDTNPDDVIPEALPTPVTKPGDLWLLGKHRIYCESALKEESFASLMQGCKASMVFIDPPYNVPIPGHVSGLGKVRHENFAMACGELNQAEFTDFLATAGRLLTLSCAEGALHFICMDWRHMEEMLAAGRKAYTELKNLCVWTKDNAGMGAMYRSQHELIFVFKQGTASHINNIQLGKFGRNRTNVWQYPGSNSFSRLTGEGNLLEMHPTAKPVSLVADAIRDCSRRGDIILDSFLGSGTTLIAAHRAKRVCYGIELNPIYVDIAVRRWQALSGQKAVHEVTKTEFDDIVSGQV